MIEVQKLPLSQTPFVNPLIKGFLKKEHKLKEFVGQFPSIDALIEKAEVRKGFPNERREVLSKVLHDQYDGYSIPSKLKEHLELLKLDGTVTITTGHQLNILTGPLYTIFKICSILKLCDDLNEQREGPKAVPIFWLASEDHDLEEIDHTTVEGQLLQWEKNSSGAVGRLDCRGLEETIKALEPLIDRFPHASELIETFKEAYSAENLASASHKLYHSLFGKHGLVVLDADSADLKMEFKSIMETELRQNKTQHEVAKTTAKLETHGFSGQVHPRDINLFYLSEGVRTRIEKTENGYREVDGDERWTEEEIISELGKHPERFSPNAIMRPMYQEVVLPNIAYIGGGGEISYWLQLKSAFDAHNVSFPILIHRDSAIMMDGGTRKRWEKNEVDPQMFFQRKDVYLKSVVSDESNVDFDEIVSRLESLFDELAEQGKAIDPGLIGMVKGEGERQKKAIGNLQGRFLKAEKQRNQTLLNQLDKLHETLLPNGKLQERIENFSGFYARHGAKLIEQIIEVCDPLAGDFKILKVG